MLLGGGAALWMGTGFKAGGRSSSHYPNLYPGNLICCEFKIVNRYKAPSSSHGAIPLVERN